MLDAVGSTTIGDVAGIHDCRLFDDRCVDVDIGHRGAIHVNNRGVIGECAAIPRAARKADAHVAAAVVHAAVEADVRSPITGMEAITTASKAPVAWSPEGADIRSRHPRAGNPVVAKEAVVPVSRRPDQIRLRAGWLHIDWQRRRGVVD